MRNSFVRNLYWGIQMAEKLSVLKPQKSKNLFFFLSFSYYSFEDEVTKFGRDMFRIFALLPVPVFSMAQTLPF